MAKNPVTYSKTMRQAAAAKDLPLVCIDIEDRHTTVPAQDNFGRITSYGPKTRAEAQELFELTLAWQRRKHGANDATALHPPELLQLLAKGLRALADPRITQIEVREGHSRQQELQVSTYGGWVLLVREGDIPHYAVSAAAES